MAANGESEKSEENQAGIDWGIRGRPFLISSLLLFTLSFAFFYTKKPSGYLFANLWLPIIAPGRDENERVEFTRYFSVYTKADSVCR